MIQGHCSWYVAGQNKHSLFFIDSQHVHVFASLCIHAIISSANTINNIFYHLTEDVVNNVSVQLINRVIQLSNRRLQLLHRIIRTNTTHFTKCNQDMRVADVSLLGFWSVSVWIKYDCGCLRVDEDGTSTMRFIKRVLFDPKQPGSWRMDPWPFAALLRIWWLITLFNDL